MVGLGRQRIESACRFGVAELIPDRLRDNGWTVAVDGVAQSYVDLAEPARLKMPFAAWLGQAIDRHWEPGAAVSGLFIGGAGCTLPRYVAATRPGSVQTVYELDGPLVDLVREHLELDRVPGLRVVVQDGRSGVEAAAAGSVDLVLSDVFQAGNVVTELATVEFASEVSRVLRPGGLYAVNMWDGPDLGFALRAVASIAAVLPHVLVIAQPGVLLRRQAGNVVVIASTRGLAVAELVEWGAAAETRVSCLTPTQLAAVCGTAAPLTEADPLVEPVRPVQRWGYGSRFT
ncbi:spermidine synthase [Saccharopolyspora sp. 5N708]|uniref:spermidine synthase n=1 Tax=Saccharopolyspora sp. 5N708 TaxID=3457424 RepID=UPI003FD1FCAA